MVVREDPEAAGAERRLESVTTRVEMARLLVEQRVRADVSLRELQAWANKAGRVPLPRTTCSDMLAGRRFPKKAVMMTFLRGCHVPEQQLSEWARAWERVKVAEEAAGTVAAGVGVGSGRPVRERRMTRRRVGRAGVLIAAVLIVAAVAAALIAVGYREWGHEPVSPAGRAVTDDGRAFGPGGSSMFTVTVDPANTGVRLIRRFDAGIARQAASVTVNGGRAGGWQPLSAESAYRWKDQSIELPLRLTAGRHSLVITNTYLSSTQDFNEFTYFIDAKVNGVWSRADVVDVGPFHPADEAAHRYLITGQTYAGSRDFEYRNQRAGRPAGSRGVP